VQLADSAVGLNWTLEIGRKSVHWVHLAQVAGCSKHGNEPCKYNAAFLTRGQWTPKKSVYRFQRVRELEWEEMTALLSLRLCIQ